MKQQRCLGIYSDGGADGASLTKEKQKEGNKNMKKKIIAGLMTLSGRSIYNRRRRKTSISKHMPIRFSATSLALTTLVIISLICGCISPSELGTDRTYRLMQADLLFTAPGSIMALSCDQEENVYIVTYEGDITRITPDGKSKDIYSGLDCCGFSRTALTIDPNGDLIVNDCIDEKNVIVKIDQKGSKTTLIELEENLVSITSDSSGRLYLGIWVTKSYRLGVSCQPFNHLIAAEHLSGQILVLGEDGEIDKLYEGGLPLALATSKTSGVYASIWGDRGRFSAKDKAYSVCDFGHSFWICLSDTVEIREISRDQGEHLITSGLDAVSSIATNKEGFTFVVGKDETDCGIYEIKQGQDPRRLLFSEDDVDVYITGLALSDSNLYFSDGDGNVYRVGLSNLYE